MFPPDSRREGEPHRLFVYETEPPDGKFDNWHLEYEIEHLPTCPKDTFGWPGNYYEDADCGLAWEAREGDLSFALEYSGTPITEPGHYLVAQWGSKTYYFEYGAYEYDSGVYVIRRGV